MKKLQLFIYIFIFGSLFFVGGTIAYFATSFKNNSSYVVVTFDSNGGTLEKDKIKYEVGKNYKNLPTPKREGYTFDGWFTGINSGDKVTEKNKPVSPLTLYARWTFDIYNLSPIVSVNNTSVQNGEYFGTLYSTSKYINNLNVSTLSNGNVYTDNSGALQYDNDGALLLDKDNSIAVLDIDNKYKIGNNYSLSTTFYWDKSLISNTEAFSSTVVAISGTAKNYLSWVGIDQGYLFVYSYTVIDDNYIPYLGQELRGYKVVNLSEYDKSIINVQVVGVRDKKTKIYINGEKVSEFVSGSSELDYNHLTLGDLRIGRNLKFVGRIYDFAIFDKVLSDEQVKNNYMSSFAYKNSKTS